MLELIAANLMSFYETDSALVESCIGEKFQIVEYVEPRYPLCVRRSGYIDLRLYVGADGKYKDIKVIDSHPKRVFDKSARRAVKGWRFNDSKFSERCFNITLKFAISEPATKPL